MVRVELLEAASSKLIEAALLLLVAGEDRLATEIEEMTQWVDLKVLLDPARTKTGVSQTGISSDTRGSELF